MTPTELLDQAKSHFLVLYHTDATALGRLLAEALRTYRDKAGVIDRATFPADVTAIDVPPHFFKVAVAEDATGNYHEAHVDAGKVAVSERTGSTRPYTLHYFVDLASYGPDEDLPETVVGKTLEYLIALIDIPNTQRARRTNAATGLQAELPSDEALAARRDQVKLEMEEEEAMVPMASVRV